MSRKTLLFLYTHCCINAEEWRGERSKSHNSYRPWDNISNSHQGAGPVQDTIDMLMSPCSVRIGAMGLKEFGED